jgi:hypothetical protein
MERTEPFREPPDHAGRDVCRQHVSSPLGSRTAQRPGAGCDIDNPGTRADAQDVQPGVRNRSGDPVCGRLVDCGKVPIEGCSLGTSGQSYFSPSPLALRELMSIHVDVGYCLSSNF